MAQDTNIQGLACDHASLEISIDGAPVPESFTSIDPKCAREFEKLWLNGRSDPIQRTQGKIDPTADAEMPAMQFWSLVDRLGGQGDDPNAPDFMFTEFEVLLSFRPKNQPRTFQMALHGVTIKDFNVSSSHGKAAMAKLSLDALGLEILPAQ